MIEQLLNALGQLRQEQQGVAKRTKEITARAWEITRELLIAQKLVEGPVGIVVQGEKFLVVDGKLFEDEASFLSEVQEHLCDGEGANFVVLAQTGFIAMGGDPQPIVSVIIKTPTETFAQFAPVDTTADGWVMVGEIETPPLEAFMPYAEIGRIHWSLQ